jgi:anti-anti-sigma factor
MMTAHETNESVARIEMSGHLDAAATERIAGDFAAAIDSGAGQVVVDMCGVSFLSAAATKFLISVSWALTCAGRQLSLVACQPDVADLIDIIVPDRLMKMYDTEAEALAVHVTATPVHADAPRPTGEIAYFPSRRVFSAVPARQPVQLRTA